MIKTLVVLVGLFMLCGCAAKVKTNADKCKDAGGTYNARTNSCQFQSELPKK